MPIDIGLLRLEEEGGNLNQVRKWQILRYGGSNEEARHLLHDIQALDVERRRLLRNVNNVRTRLHTLQRSIKDSKEKEQVKMEMKDLKQQVIPDMVQTLEGVSKELDAKLSQVANCVIVPSLDNIESSPLVEPTTESILWKKPQEIVVDPLYCLRGFETVKQGCNVLTGTGAALARSLSDYALHFCRNHSTISSFSSTILPFSVEMETARAHSIMGCSPSCAGGCLAGESSSTTTTPVPPWVATLLLHEEQTYFDRQLPLGRLITTFSSVGSGDNRRTNAASKRKSLCSGERIELLGLTGNTISESNTMQLELVNAIVEFHQSLLVMNDSCKVLNVRMIEPQHLQPCEASRVVIEGIIMLGTKKSRTMMLGYVSNMTDYSTRAIKTKIGGSLGYCFAIHGVLCSIPETIEWMLQHNVIEYEKELGAGLPTKLSFHVQEQLGMAPPDKGVLFLPFTRRLFHGKSGKMKRTELGNASKPRVIQAVSNSSPKQTLECTSAREEREPFVRKGPLTAQDIANERLMCPYGVLPIGR